MKELNVKKNAKTDPRSNALIQARYLVLGLPTRIMFIKKLDKATAQVKRVRPKIKYDTKKSILYTFFIPLHVCYFNT